MSIKAALLGICVSITVFATAQNYGSGLGKTTYTASDAIGVSQWLLSLLPTQPDHPNGPDACGQLGRVRLMTSPPPPGACWLKSGKVTPVPRPADGASYATVAVLPKTDGCDYIIGDDVTSDSGTGTSVSASSPAECCAACAKTNGCTGASYVAGTHQGYTNGFGLHAVHVNDTTSRGFGAMSNVEVEKALDEKLGAVYKGGGYDAFLDFTSGHWVSTLDAYTDSFDTVGVPYVKLAWRDAANGGKLYYSVIVRVHTSMMLMELMSETCQACSKDPSNTIQYPDARYHFEAGSSPVKVFGNLSDTTAARPLLHPARVSWPTSNHTRDRAFFAASGLATTVYQGAAHDVYNFEPFNPEATMQFHLVEKPSGNTTGTLTIAGFESVMLGAHQKYLVDDVCGFDQWLDNHLAVSSRTTTWDIGKLQKLLVSFGLRYHVLDNRGMHNIYASAPNGLTLQFAGLDDGNYTPSRPFGGSSVNLCGNGTCANTTQ